MAESVLLLGGASTLGHATARLFAAEGAAIALVGRDQAALGRVGDDLVARGAPVARVFVHDLTTVEEAVFASWCEAAGGFDLVILAYGVLGDQDEAADDPAAQRRILDSNFVSAAGWLNLAARHLEARGGGRLVVFGSVAGDRPRKPNYIYGASKAALHFYAEGLGLAAAERGVGVLLVKPGQTRTAMTRHMASSGALWSDPEVVAGDVHRAVRRGRRVVYSPWHWRWIMWIIRSIPHALFRRLRI